MKPEAILCAVLNFFAIMPAVADSTTAEQVGKVSGAAANTHVDKRKYSEDGIKHYNAAVELHQENYVNQALAEYQIAVEHEPRMGEAWSNMAGIYAAQGDSNAAIEALQKALAVALPNSAQMFSIVRQLAEQYVIQRKYAEAEVLYKQDVEAPEPKGLWAGCYADTLHEYAKLLRKMDRDNEADALEIRANSIRANKSAI